MFIRPLVRIGLRPTLKQAALRPTGRTVIPGNAMVRRIIQTESLPASAAQQILNKQRLRRPSSPTFTIYQPQYTTWIGSIVSRICGTGLSVLLYAYALAYLAAPTMFDSMHVIEIISGLPDAVKYAGKAILAAPFAFHGLSGLRLLSLDIGKFLTLRGAHLSGCVVFGATALTTVALMSM